MRLILLLLTFAIAWLFVDLNYSSAQIQRREFIESSSPLPSGGQVISRSEPGRGVQTFIVLPSGNPAINNPQSVLNQNPAASQETALRQSTQNSNATVGQSNANANATYLYPTGNQVTPSFVLYPPVRASALQNQQIPWQIPTLGLSDTITARRAQSGSNCDCNPRTSQPAPSFQGPVLQIQPPASQVPTLTTPNQGQTATTVNMISPVGVQQNGWWSPIVSGSGVYQPVVRLANLPPGTHVGQGIIGQPTAYVDGQPIRNLMRYVFP